MISFYHEAIPKVFYQGTLRAGILALGQCHPLSQATTFCLSLSGIGIIAVAGENQTKSCQDWKTSRLHKGMGIQAPQNFNRFRDTGSSPGVRRQPIQTEALG